MRRAVAASAAVVVLTLGLAGCGSADPAAVAAVGLDDSGYLAVVQMCDQGRTFTHAGFVETADGETALSWIGRTVEPVTLFRISEDPPDNWVVDTEGGLRSGVEYRFEATASDDLTVAGPEFTLDDLNTLGIGEVIAADGVVSTLDEFLDEACATMTP